MNVGGPSPPGSADPLIDRVLSDRYRILQKLGEGGMGVVYLAEHVVIEKKIALKVLFPDLTRRSDLVQRFMQEAKSASRIGHENVIDITDFGQSPEGYVFIAMEYLVGQDLGQLLKASGPLPWARAQPIVLQIVKALRAAHERGIVHRDMKPENVFVSPRDDGREFVKVLDFGIAKVLGLDEEAPRLTRTGMIFGTPEYMSPEQAQGQQVDHRVDIYAVGCLMYHMLTGEVPFKAESFMGILSKHMLEIPLAPTARNASIEAEVEAVINRAMQKDPAARFQTMGEFVQALVPLGYIPDKSGAISLSTGISKPQRTGMPAPAPAPSAATAPPTATAPQATSAVAAVPSAATKEVASRVSVPLAQSNPEVRRSQTEIFARSEGDGADTRHTAGNASRIRLMLGASAGALALLAILFLLLRGGSASRAQNPAQNPATGAPHVPSPTAAAAMLQEVPASSNSAPLAAPTRGETAAGQGASPIPQAAEAIHGGSRKTKEGTRMRRTSREAIDSLFPSERSDVNQVPATGSKKDDKNDSKNENKTGRTPSDLKNPFD